MSKNEDHSRHHEEKAPPPPLKDPAEGKPPALREGHLVKADAFADPGGATYQGGDPTWVNESMPTIGDEQRARSAKIEEMGIDAYMAQGETPTQPDPDAYKSQELERESAAKLTHRPAHK